MLGGDGGLVNRGMHHENEAPEQSIHPRMSKVVQAVFLAVFPSSRVTDLFPFSNGSSMSGFLLGRHTLTSNFHRFNLSGPEPDL